MYIVLLLQKENGGIIMVNFFPDFVKCAPNATLSDVAGMYTYTSTAYETQSFSICVKTFP